jgi:hypothetical protein
MREVNLYYGMSGTLKSATISRFNWPWNEDAENTVIIKSSIKVWKNNRDLLFPWLKGESNLVYSLLHLTRLEDYVFGDYKYIIERGITDSLYYESLKDSERVTPSIISSAVNRESEILQPGMIKKTLMIMLDKDFIRNKTLSEKTRADWFQGVEDYLEKQEDYVKFTKKYNDITEIIEIKDAREYLESLGIEYNV